MLTIPTKLIVCLRFWNPVFYFDREISVKNYFVIKKLLRKGKVKSCVIGTEGALRRPMTYDDHRSIQSHPIPKSLDTSGKCARSKTFESWHQTLWRLSGKMPTLRLPHYVKVFWYFPDSLNVCEAWSYELIGQWTVNLLYTEVCSFRPGAGQGHSPALSAWAGHHVCLGT